MALGFGFKPTRTSALCALLPLAVASLLLQGCLGVEGGAEALQTKFTGIDKVTVVSPTSAVVEWTPLQGYTNYDVYVSTQDAPIGHSVFNKLQITNLKPNTSYTFSVAGVSDTGQHGIGKQVSAQTWMPFLGVTSATAKDSADITLTWKYNAGPSFKVFYNIGSPPSEAQVKGSANLISQSNSGVTVGGLQPNTTYFFSVTASYADGTSTIDSLSIPTQTLTAVYTSSELLAGSTPTISTAASLITGNPGKFAVSGGTGTLTTYAFATATGVTQAACNADTLPAAPNRLGSVLGAGTITTTSTYSTISSYVNPIFVVRDSITGKCAFATLSTALGATSAGFQIVSNPVSALPYVSATTPTSLTPLPTVTAPSQQLGNFPTFIVTGALSSYRTTLYYNPPSAAAATSGTNIGSVVGNGAIHTLTNPITSQSYLPRGQVTLYPVVTAGGQTAYLPPISVYNRSIDAAPYTGPTKINGGGYGGGMGKSSVAGDFNCDGYQDLAVGIPFGDFAQPTGYLPSNDYLIGGNGAVAVYYGSNAGLVGMDKHDGAGGIKPSTTATGTQPLLIPSPDKSAYAYSTLHFGVSLATGHINGKPTAGTACSDLIVGAPSAAQEGGQTTGGAIYIYYGSTSGLQVSTPAINSVTCSVGSDVCGASKVFPPNAEYAQVYYFYSDLGFSTGLAAGDFNGDGYDDVAVGDPRLTDLKYGAGVTTQYDGVVFLYYGTPNGLSPSGQKILMPVNAELTRSAGAQFGYALAFGTMSDEKTPSCSAGAAYCDPIAGGSGTPKRKKDLLIAAPAFLGAASASGGTVFWVKGTSSITTSLDGDSHLKGALVGSNYSTMSPGQCSPANGAYMAYSTCGYPLATADTNLDGWEEVILGGNTLNSHAGVTNNGAVFVYYGSSVGPQGTATLPVANQTTCTADNMPTSCNPQILFRTDDTTGWRFGAALANVGDTNGDDYPEVGIGAIAANPAKNGAVSNNGVAYIYYSGARGLIGAGSPVLNLGAPAFSYFRTSLPGRDLPKATFAAGTPCNGKKCSDIALGAPGQSVASGSSGHGVVNILKNNGSGIVGGTLVSPIADNGALNNVPAKFTGQNFEKARIVGDLNGDGYSDVAAAVLASGTYALSNSYLVTPTRLFATVVYYGSSSGLVAADTSGNGPSFVPLQPTAPLLITGPAFNSLSFTSTTMGTVVNPAGDMNGDGFDDLSMGSSADIYLFYGSSNGIVAYTNFGGNVSGVPPLYAPAQPLDPKVITAYPVYSAGNNYHGLSTHGDFNGDGYDDLAVSALGTMATGIINIIYGSPYGPISKGAIYSQGAAGYTGASHQTLAVRVPTCATDSAGAQVCQVLEICTGIGAPYCNAGFTPAVNPAFGHVNGAGSNSATALINVGDIDKDGSDDLVAGAAWDTTLSAAPNYSGALFIYYGSTSDGISPSRYVKMLIPNKYGTTELRNVGGGFNGIEDLYTFVSSVGRAYDVNGDGIGDFVVGVGRETSGTGTSQYAYGGAAYMIYGINGGYRALGAGVCAAYPCTVTLSNSAGNAADYNATHIVDRLNTSCDPGTNTCNPLRFYPTGALTQVYFAGGGTQGVGDITGDTFGDVVVVNGSGGATYANKITIFSGSQSGLQVTGAYSTQPVCASGICTPYSFTPPDGAYTPTGGTSLVYRAGSWLSPAWTGAGDVDGDGKRDFLISSRSINSADGTGYYTGGFFLFH